MDPKEWSLSRWEVTRVYRRDLTGSIVPQFPRVACRVARIGADEAGILEPLARGGRAAVARRMERGDRCYVAWVAGEPAHFCWTQTAGWHFLYPAGLWRQVQAGEVWLYHAFTAPPYRGQRLCAYVLTSILLDYLREGGIRTAFAYTTRANQASQRSMERAGMDLVETLPAFCVRGLYVPVPGLEVVRNGARRAEFSTSAVAAFRELWRRVGVRRRPGGLDCDALQRPSPRRRAGGGHPPGSPGTCDHSGAELEEDGAHGAESPASRGAGGSSHLTGRARP